MLGIVIIPNSENILNAFAIALLNIITLLTNHCFQNRVAVPLVVRARKDNWSNRGRPGPARSW
jgi:hypothetical protein